MTKQFVSIVAHPILYNILDEINSLFSFEIINFESIDLFLKEVQNEHSDILESIIILKKNNQQLLDLKVFDINNIIILDDSSVKINHLLDKINILLIKKNYNFQSQINIKDYNLNLNTRTISNQNNVLKLSCRILDKKL